MRVLSHSLLILPLVAGFPTLSAAQSLPEGLDVRGVIELEALSSGSADQTVVYGDLDVSFGFGAGSMGLGLDLGFLAFDSDNDSEGALFAALTYGTEFGKISVGAPRGALGDFTRMPAVGGVQLLDLELSPYLGDVVDYAALVDSETPLGLRYDGQYGNLRVGASYHNFNDQDAEVIDLALGYQTGIFFVAGGVELIDTPGGSDSDIYHIEAGAEAEYYSAGIGFTSTDDFGGDATMAWASYSALPNTDLTVTVFDLDGTTLYGLSGEWRFLSHSFVQLGVADTTDSDAIWDASIGLRF
ncbi:hypothetical protein [Albidovulum sediminis]|uniref:Porin n=1 Tax=Albidovulum sediminis TaxID=3066345 RepID=A0ABT2NL33_9RHOB|nr:hypothetical protein [Defluviimonas sediminis]MCT8328798.1 hypothetical protein [Defluviimonas sediminis]